MNSWRKYFTDEEMELAQQVTSQFAAVTNNDPSEQGIIKDPGMFERVMRILLMCSYRVTECSVDIEIESDE